MVAILGVAHRASSNAHVAPSSILIIGILAVCGLAAGYTYRPLGRHRVARDTALVLLIATPLVILVGHPLRSVLLLIGAIGIGLMARLTVMRRRRRTSRTAAQG
jgi:hypothetical protein